MCVFSLIYNFNASLAFRIEFVSDKKSMGAGKKRTITFNQGDSEQEVIEAKGILKGDLAVYINDGLPNTSSKPHNYLIVYKYFVQKILTNISKLL